MNQEEINQEAEWLRHLDLIEFMQSDRLHSPWFPAFKSTKSLREETRWFSALVPVAQIPALISKSNGWDIGPSDGSPSVWTHYAEGKVSERKYCPYGNEEGIEPLVIYRSFHGMRTDSLELSQEFRLFHNLFHDLKRNQYLKFDSDGDESVAVRQGETYVEILTELVREFCDVKQVALAVYLESFRYSKRTLADLELTEQRDELKGDRYKLHLAVVPEDEMFHRAEIETRGLMIGAKKYILPGPMPSEKDKESESFQEFIIGEDTKGKPVKYSCDPDVLADYFGKNPGAPNYLTPVFFRPEVLGKYYQEPDKYSVEDGYIRCGGLWGLRLDNDNPDYVMVFLGDLGTDLSEKERNYWLNFNISPQGRRMSQTTFKRSFMAEFADPSRPDHAFKQVYKRFREEYKEKWGWDFLLPLHDDDEHFLTALHLPANDNQADFDRQLLALTKVLIDCLNEAEIAKHVKNITTGDKGIAKLAKFLSERAIQGFEEHIKFLRVLQDLRSRSAAHRKGSQYDKLVAALGLTDEGQKIVFSKLLVAGCSFLEFLFEKLCAVPTSLDRSQAARDMSGR